MSTIAGLSQQIVSASKRKAPENAQPKSNDSNSAGKFEDKFKDKFDSKLPKDRLPVSKNKSVESKKSSSPEKEINTTEKRIEERAEERIQEKANLPSKSLTKKEAMWAFLDRMDQQLGVEPSQVLNAFAQLDVDNLMAPPETSADEFVQNLDLPPGQEEQALNLYSQLLTWTSAASLSQQLQQQGQNADLNVMNAKEYQTQQRMAGLSELSDKFFMNGDHTRDSVLQSRQNMAGFSDQNGLGRSSSDIADRLMNMQQSAEQKPVVGSTEELLREMQSELKNQKNETLSKAEISQLGFQQKMNAIKTYGQQPQVTQQPIAAAQDLTGMNLENVDQLDSVFEPTVQAVQSKDMTAFANTGEGDAQPEFSEGNFSTQNQITPKAGQAAGSEFIVKAPQPTETEMSENIREIINKAQVMVKDGGGEMKVSLRPDGMGNVNLKVNVVGGNVSVEMVTASDETRKALEKGLGDLKDNLSLQKLNVDQIKVESMQEAADKLMEEKQEQAERHFQERFLQDFKNQNGSRFSNSLSTNEIGRPDSQKLEEGQPEIESNSEKSRRLDLVA